MSIRKLILLGAVLGMSLCAVAAAKKSASKGKTVEASGIGSGLEAALMDAYRSAIIRAGYMEISADQKAKDGVMSYDEVTVKAHAYIGSYEMIKNGADPKTGLDKVVIKAQVFRMPKTAKKPPEPVEYVTCPTCHGSRTTKFSVTCAKCGGGGRLPDVAKRGIGGRVYVHRGGECPSCRGKGELSHSETCSECNGKGKIRADDVVVDKARLSNRRNGKDVGFGPGPSDDDDDGDDD